MSRAQEQTRSVELPVDIVERVEARVGRTEFESPEAYIAWILDEVLAEVEASADEEFSAVDEAQVKEQLESLGYLNG